MGERDRNLLSEESIVKAIELARARASQAEHGRADLDRTIAKAREEERLLQRLLDVRRGTSPTVEPKLRGSTVNRDASPTRPASIPGSKHPVVQAVIDELATTARPLHISELMRLLHDRNVPIPGAGVQANLIAHLRRDARLIRTSRGMYGLSTWGLESMGPARRVRRRRSRVRATAAK